MIALPLPLIFAFLILFLLLRSLRDGTSFQVFHLLLLCCAAQSLLIAMVHYYGVPGLRLVLPVTASALPPLAWLAFRATLFARVTLAQALPQALAPLFILFCILVAPWTVDISLPLVFAGYGVAILWSLRPATELPLARLDAGPWPARIWRALAAALIISAIGDVVISWAFATGRPEWRGPVVSLVSSVSVLLVALLALSRDDIASPDPEEPARPPSAPGAPEAEALMARLDTLMASERLFLDPGLTLARLARRLSVPLKALSAAINGQTGENVSRYVNGFRIRHACTLLEQGQPVTEVVFAAGFNTKSNFNREFLRVTGVAPSAWRGSD